MKNILKIISVSLALLIFTGCTAQSQSMVKNNELKENKALELNVKDETGNNNPASSSFVELAAKSSKEGNDKETEKKPLEGLTICIDAGHGKITKKVPKTEPLAPGSKTMKAAVASGTTGVATKITEESLNLTVSLKLKKALAEKGARIIMVRDTHVCNMTNVERAKFWNASGADLTIRIHANGSESKKASGVLMMVPGDKYIKDKDMLEKSAKAGKFIMEEVLKSTKSKSGGTVKSTDLTGFNWSEIPVMLLEMGFMTNPQEDKLLNTAAYQNKIVSGIVTGVERYNSYIKSK